MDHKCFSAGLSLIFILLTVQSKAQEKDTIPVPRWEVGVDLLSLFSKNKFPELSIFGRYLLNPGKEKNTHLRFRLGYDAFHYLDSTTLGRKEALEYSSFSPFVMAGLQKELVRKDQSSLYGAVDLSYSRQAYDAKFGPIDPDKLHFLEGFEWEKQTLTALHAVFGFTQRLTPQLSFSLESSLSVSWRRYQFKEETWIFDDGSRPGTPSGRIIDTGSKSVLTSINPFHQVFLTYKF